MTEKRNKQNTSVLVTEVREKNDKMITKRLDDTTKQTIPLDYKEKTNKLRDVDLLVMQ